MNKLFEAIERGDAGTVWQLVQNGADPEAVDEATQLTPLALAAEAGHVEIVRTLLEAGANPDNGGATSPLEAAVVEGHRAVVMTLIEASADVNLAIADGFTPLMTAALTDNLDLALALLTAGARPRQKNDDGDTAITLAEGAGHNALAVVLKGERWKRKPGPKPAPAAEADAVAPAAKTGGEARAPADRAPADRAEEQTAPVGETAVDAPPPPAPAAADSDLDGGDAEGRTPLMAAAADGDVERVRALIAAGAEIDAGNQADGGRTALVYAVRSPSRERHEVIALLAAAGADLDRPCGRNRRTALMHAAEADVYSEREDGGDFGGTTRQLIELGAALGATDRRNQTVWRQIKRDALGAPTVSPSRRRLHQMLRLLESCGARPVASHWV